MMVVWLNFHPAAMNKPVIVLLIFLGMMIVPWFFEKFSKPAKTSEKPDDSARPEISIRRKRKQKRAKNYEQPKEVFPDYDPNYDDEIEWRTKIEAKFRKYSGYPPDWERRRVLVYLRDNAKCQGDHHRGGTCGRLLCEPSQIWNFKYNVKLLVDAHVDHITSIYSGGGHSLENLQLLCPRCHAIKHPNNSKLDAMSLPKPLPRGIGRKKAFTEFYTRKAPKPPDDSVPF
jgi:5-methylcytosine-specific restriction endonuclease McrA